MRIAKEGYRFIVPAASLAAPAFVIGWTWLGLGLGLLALAFAGFFRDPERTPPRGEGLILSPADGRVVGIGEVERKGIAEGPATRVSIFLSPLDVHINRAPISGTVEEVRYEKGEFRAAFKDEASASNERNAVRIVDDEGRELGVVQIAGVLARRIVCYVKPGDSLALGQRFGLIMFGSRVDVYLPARSRVEASAGQRVRAGESVIGRFS